MYIPAVVITYINDLPAEGVQVEALLGFIGSKIEDSAQVSKEQFLDYHKRLEKFPPAVLARYAHAFNEEYLAKTFEDYQMVLDPEGKSVKDSEAIKSVTDFHEYYPKLVISNMDLMKYFDSLMGEIKEEGEDFVDTLKYKVVPQEDDTFPEMSFMMLSQKDSIKRMKLLGNCTSGKASSIFFVSNIIDAILKHPVEVTEESLENLLGRDLAIFSSEGYTSKITSRRVAQFLKNNFDELSKEHF